MNHGPLLVFCQSVAQTVHTSHCWISTPLNHLPLEIVSDQVLVSLTERPEQLQHEQQRLARLLVRLSFRRKQHLFRIHHYHKHRYHKHRYRSMGRSRSELVGRQLVVRSESS